MSYLKNLAETFAREVGDDLKHYVFVFPNQRAGLFFRRDLGLALGHPALSPQILTINDCFYSLTDTQLADPIDLLLRITRIHNEIREEQHLAPEPLDKFLFWGKMLLSDFNEIDNHLVSDVRRFFDNIHDLHSIDTHFNSPSGAPDTRHQTPDTRHQTSDTKHYTPDTYWESPLPLYELYTRLQSELRAEGLAYDGMRHREVIERLTAQRSFSPKDGLSAEGDPTGEAGLSSKTYVFIGFNALTVSEERLMLYFKERGQADFYFDYSDPLVTRKDNRASLFMEHNLQLFPSKYNISPNSKLSPEGRNQTASLNFKLSTLNYIEVNSTVAEAQEVHRILESLSAEGGLTAKRSYSEAVFQGSGLTRTAVVLPDERLLIPLLHTLPKSINKVNVTMGYPLSATPTYALISLITDLQKRMTSDGFYHKDVTAILSHPYIHRLAPEMCDAIKQDIVKRNRIYVDAATFAKDENLAHVFSTEPDAWRDILNHFPEDASEAVYRVQTVLNRIDKYYSSFNSKLSSEGRNQTATFHTALPIVPPGAKNFQLSTLNLMLSTESIPYTGEPLEGLQVMGILETRALDFDNIILTGFNDDLYPGNSIANSFIPYQMRCQYGLPTAERKDAIFAYNFYRMIGYAKQVWFIANTRSDEQHSGEPSRYLYQLQYQFGKDINHIVVQDSLTASNPTAQRSYSDSGLTGEAGLSAVNVSLAQHSFTPSGLNTYLRCPRLFYWKYIRGLREPEEVKEDIDPRELGTQLHLLLQNFYEPFCGKTVTKEDITAMLRQLPTDNTPLSMLLREYAGLILERDLALAPFTYIASEQPRQMQLTLEDGSIVTLKGTIDRVDTKHQTPDTIHQTHYRIVDYKTGGAKLEFSSIASLFDPTDNNRNSYALQTILYSILYESGLPSDSDGSDNTNHMVIEPHIYGVRLLAKGSQTAVHQKGQEVVDVATIKEEFIGCIRKLISEIRHPENTFPCKENTFNNCEHCPFLPLCEK